MPHSVAAIRLAFHLTQAEMAVEEVREETPVEVDMDRFS